MRRVGLSLNDLWPNRYRKSGCPETASFLNLSLEDHAYFFGLIQTDGHFAIAARNRGRVSIELAAKDRPILEMLAKLFPYHFQLTERIRDTNFSSGYRTVILNTSDQNLRKDLLRYGLRPGRKSSNVSVPVLSYHRRGYWRGVIDGDGSLGLTAAGLPFLALVTASQALYEQYVQFVEQITEFRPRNQRNERDGVYNITVFRENAVAMASFLYRDAALALPRKLEKAELIHGWRRPEGSPAYRIQFHWNPEADDVVRNKSVKEAATALRLTSSAVANRRFRLRGMANRATGAH